MVATMTTFLHNLPEDEPDVIQMCDVEVYGQCDRCDHPCLAYFEHKAWWDNENTFDYEAIDYDHL